MRSYRRLAALVAMALTVSLFMGCTDDPTTSNNSNNFQPPDPSEVPADGQLLHVEPTCDPGSISCLVDLTWSSSKTLEAKLVDADGQPVENAEIAFESDQTGAEGTLLSAQRVFTNEDGVAEIELTAATDSGSAEIFATAQDLEPIKWVVGISSKGSASYRVSFDHSGDANMKDIQVRLYEPSISCDDYAANPAQTSVYQRSNLVDAQGNLPTVVFPEIDNGASFTAVAYAFSAQNDEVEVAYGCKDENDPIENGQPVDVIVPLLDHVPTIVGEYNVTHTFNLTSALPPNVQRIIDLVGLLATDPGAFFVGCPDGASGCPSGGLDGLAQLLLEVPLPGNIRTTIEDFLDSQLANGALRTVINDLVNGWIEENAPPWVANAQDITGDIYDTLREFRVEGIIRISEPPVIDTDDQTGERVPRLADGSAEQIWTDVLFYWSRGCDEAADFEACREGRSFSASEFTTDGSVVQGDFTGSFASSNQLIINNHGLTLNYGALLVGVVEKVVLPAVFGDNCGTSNSLPCDSLELAIQEILSCEQVAGSVANPGDALYGIAEQVCTNLLAEATDRLRDYATETLVAEGDDVFKLGTPAGAPCTLYQPEIYGDEWPGKPLPYIEKFGRDEPEDLQCEWEVSINLSSGPATMDGTFHGTRSDDL